MTTTLDPTSRSRTAITTTSTRTSHAGVRRQTLGRAIVSEWVKMRTLRSTWVSLGSLLVLLIGVGAIAAQVSSNDLAAGGDGGPGGGDPLSTVLLGANFAVLLAGVMGSLAGAREFSSRMIAATAAAVPRRWQIVTAKAVVLTAVAVPTALIGVLGAFFAGMAILESRGGSTVALGDSGILRSVLGMAAYIGVIALLGLGLGVLLRSVASSIGTIVAGVLILPTLAAALLPASLDSALQYLPSSAASAFTAVQGAGDAVLSAGAGALVLAAWLAATLAAAVVAITRRDV